MGAAVPAGPGRSATPATAAAPTSAAGPGDGCALAAGTALSARRAGRVRRRPAADVASVRDPTARPGPSSPHPRPVAPGQRGAGRGDHGRFRRSARRGSSDRQRDPARRPASALDAGRGARPDAGRRRRVRLLSSYAGTQVFTAYRDGRVPLWPTSTSRRWPARAPRSLVRQSVRAADSSQHFPRRPSARGWSTTSLLALLESNYTLAGRTGAHRGRPAGRRWSARHARAGPVAARWWIDDDTGLLLWHETYDAPDCVELSLRVSPARFTTHATQLIHLPPAGWSSRASTSSLTLSAAATGRGRSAGSARPELAGLSLVRLRSDQAGGPSVHPAGLQRRAGHGQRVRAARAARRRRRPDRPGTPSLRRYLGHGASESATWQSGDTVFTVVTDGRNRCWRRPCRALPHESGGSPSTMDADHGGLGEDSGRCKGLGPWSSRRSRDGAGDDTAARSVGQARYSGPTIRVRPASRIPAPPAAPARHATVRYAPAGDRARPRRAAAAPARDRHRRRDRAAGRRRCRLRRGPAGRAQRGRPPRPRRRPSRAPSATPGG